MVINFINLLLTLDRYTGGFYSEHRRREYERKRNELYEAAFKGDYKGVLIPPDIRQKWLRSGINRLNQEYFDQSYRRVTRTALAQE